MSATIALLRAVNVGGGRTVVAMATLREMVSALGFDDVRSLLQTGNLVFRGDGRSAGVLEELLEAEAARRLNLRTDVFVRTAAEWQKVIARNPFPAEAESDPAHLVVMALKEAPTARAVAALQEAITGPEIVRAGTRHLYITYPDGIGRSRLTAAVIEKHVGCRGTARNWNTALRLNALAGERP